MIQVQEEALQPTVDNAGFVPYLPVPYRIPFIIALGVFLFGTNLTILIRAKIDVEGLFYPSAIANQHLGRRHNYLSRPVYAVAIALFFISLVGTIGFCILDADSANRALNHRWLPFGMFLSCGLILFLPKHFYATERYAFIKVLRRVLLGGIDATDRFLDVIVADILTSYAKVFGDVVISCCILFSASQGPYQEVVRECAQSTMVPIAIAAPYAMRLRQCLIEYRRTRGKAHLANAAKYCSAFPVILISFLQLRRSGRDSSVLHMDYFSDGTLYKTWILACICNSAFSFWWDVTKDWDLVLLSNRRETVSSASQLYMESMENTKKSPGLRNHLTFTPGVYYVVIGLDLILRMLWSVKLSPHLHYLAEYESGVFIMECLEVLRRWMWIFLRVECEHHRVASHERHIALDELGGIAFTNGKLDQD